MKRPKFQIWKSKSNGEWRCHLLARNGRISIPPEGMKRRSGLKKAIIAAVTAAEHALWADADGARIEEIEDPNAKGTWDDELGHKP